MTVDQAKRPAKRHQMPCHSCQTSDAACLRLPNGRACCRKCADQAGTTHSRQSIGGQWIPL